MHQSQAALKTQVDMFLGANLVIMSALVAGRLSLLMKREKHINVFNVSFWPNAKPPISPPKKVMCFTSSERLQKEERVVLWKTIT